MYKKLAVQLWRTKDGKKTQKIWEDFVFKGVGLCDANDSMTSNTSNATAMPQKLTEQADLESGKDFLIIILII